MKRQQNHISDREISDYQKYLERKNRFKKYVKNIVNENKNL